MTSALAMDLDLAADLASRTFWEVGQWLPTIAKVGGAVRARALLDGAVRDEVITTSAEATPELLWVLSSIDLAAVPEPVPP